MKTMKSNINRSDLVSFGEYLLSEERQQRITKATPEGISIDERLKDVYHADIENWKEKNAECSESKS